MAQRDGGIPRRGHHQQGHKPKRPFAAAFPPDLAGFAQSPRPARSLQSLSTMGGLGGLGVVAPAPSIPVQQSGPSLTPFRRDRQRTHTLLSPMTALSPAPATHAAVSPMHTRLNLDLDVKPIAKEASKTVLSSLGHWPFALPAAANPPAQAPSARGSRQEGSTSLATRLRRLLNRQQSATVLFHTQRAPPQASSTKGKTRTAASDARFTLLQPVHPVRHAFPIFLATCEPALPGLRLSAPATTDEDPLMARATPPARVHVALVPPPPEAVFQHTGSLHPRQASDLLLAEGARERGAIHADVWEPWHVVELACDGCAVGRAHDCQGPTAVMLCVRYSIQRIAPTST